MVAWECLKPCRFILETLDNSLYLIKKTIKSRIRQHFCITKDKMMINVTTIFSLLIKVIIKQHFIPAVININNTMWTERFWFFNNLTSTSYATGSRINCYCLFYQFYIFPHQRQCFAFAQSSIEKNIKQYIEFFFINMTYKPVEISDTPYNLTFFMFFLVNKSMATFYPRDCSTVGVKQFIKTLYLINRLSSSTIKLIYDTEIHHHFYFHRHLQPYPFETS